MLDQILAPRPETVSVTAVAGPLGRAAAIARLDQALASHPLGPPSSIGSASRRCGDRPRPDG